MNRVHPKGIHFVILLSVFACTFLSICGVTGAGLIGVSLIWVFSGKEKIANLVYFFLLAFFGLLSANASLLVSLFLIFCLTLFGPYNFDKNINSTLRLSQIKKFGIWSSILILSLGLIYTIPIKFYIYFMTRYWDHISHFGILRNIGKTQKIYDFKESELYSGWIHYPQGWHSSVFTLTGSSAFQNLETSFPVYLTAFFVTVLALIYFSFQEIISLRNLKVLFELRNISTLLYLSFSIFSLITLTLFIVQGAYVNYAFSITLIILALKNSKNRKQMYMLFAFSTISYTNFIAYLLLFTLIILLDDFKHSRQLKPKSLVYCAATLLILTYQITGVLTTKQKSGVFTGVDLSIQSAKYSLLSSAILFMIILLIFRKVITRNKEIDIALIPSIVFLLISILYAFTRFEVNYFIQKMLIASTIIVVVEVNKSIFLSQRKRSNDLKKFSKKFRKRANPNQSGKVSFVKILLSISIFSALMPLPMNSQADFILSLRSGNLIDKADILKLSRDENLYPNDLFVFSSEKNGGFQSYLLNQWVSILNSTFTDSKQNNIEQCLRNVETIINSPTRFRNYTEDIRVYSVTKNLCVS